MEILNEVISKKVVDKSSWDLKTSVFKINDSLLSNLKVWDKITFTQDMIWNETSDHIKSELKEFVWKKITLLSKDKDDFNFLELENKYWVYITKENLLNTQNIIEVEERKWIKYKIKDWDWGWMFESHIFNTREEAREHLINFLSNDYDKNAIDDELIECVANFHIIEYPDVDKYEWLIELDFEKIKNEVLDWRFNEGKFPDNIIKFWAKKERNYEWYDYWLYAETKEGEIIYFDEDLFTSGLDKYIKVNNTIEVFSNSIQFKESFKTSLINDVLSFRDDEIEDSLSSMDNWEIYDRFYSSDYKDWIKEEKRIMEKNFSRFFWIDFQEWAEVLVSPKDWDFENEFYGTLKWLVNKEGNIYIWVEDQEWNVFTVDYDQITDYFAVDYKKPITEFMIYFIEWHDHYDEYIVKYSQKEVKDYIESYLDWDLSQIEEIVLQFTYRDRDDNFFSPEWQCNCILNQFKDLYKTN